MAVEYEISGIQLPTYSCNTYYICTCRWHSYSRYSATNIFLHIELILMPQNFQIFLRHLSGHNSCFFGYSTHPWDMHYTQTFSPQLTCGHPTDALEVLCLPRTFTQASGLSSSDILHIPRTCIKFILSIMSPAVATCS